MMRNFASASSQYLQATLSKAVPIGLPMTLSAWFVMNSNASIMRVATVSTSTGFQVPVSILLNNNSANRVSTQVYNGGTNVLPDIGGAVVGKLHHACAVSSEFWCTIYLDGIRGGSSTYGAQTFSGTNNILSIGRTPSVQYMNGLAGGIALWCAALTQNEVHRLYEGDDPRSIRRGALLAYYPLGINGLSNDLPLVGQDFLTPFNSPTWHTREPVHNFTNYIKRSPRIPTIKRYDPFKPFIRGKCQNLFR